MTKLMFQNKSVNRQVEKMEKEQYIIIDLARSKIKKSKDVTLDAKYKRYSEKL